jgi:hypothetical protein
MASPDPHASPPPKGQRDLSAHRITRHALDRFVERFWTGPPEDRLAAERALRHDLRRTRRLGRNPANRAVAALGLHGDRMFVAIVQDDACTTVMTWHQFEPRLHEFGRSHLPRKRGRMLRRLRDEGAAGRPTP